MANTIQHINVGGNTYDIDLPTTASPTIAGLSISGSLTVKGSLSTTNLTIDKYPFNRAIIYMTYTAGSMTMANQMKFVFVLPITSVYEIMGGVSINLGTYSFTASKFANQLSRIISIGQSDHYSGDGIFPSIVNGTLILGAYYKPLSSSTYYPITYLSLSSSSILNYTLKYVQNGSTTSTTGNFVKEGTGTYNGTYKISYF